MQSCYYVLLLGLLLVAGVHGHAEELGGGEEAAKLFWKQALPGSPMPEAIAQLVQKAIHHPPLLEYSVSSQPQLGAGDGGVGAPFCYLGYEYGSSCAAVPVPAGVFFREGQARVGSTMEVHLPAARALPGLLLSRQEAARAPFADLAAVLARFGITPGSDMAATVRATLDSCTEPPMHGEQMVCATSLEATVAAATSMLAATTDHDSGAAVVWATASALPRGGGLPRQLYEVTAVDELDADDGHVVCHALTFPYTVYRCHMGPSTRAFVVKLRGLHHRSRGDEVAAAVAAICHLDTSSWTPNHPAFKLLDTKPGGTPVCHFLPYAHLVFGKKKKQAQGSASFLMKPSIDEVLQIDSSLAG